MIITSTFYAFLISALVLTGIIAICDAKNISQKVKTIFVALLLFNIIYLCYENFPATLTLLVFATGIILLINRLFLAKRRRPDEQPGTLVNNSKEFFLVLLIVWVIRSFVIQPYHVPTGSLEPTIMAGDFIAVNQFAYGLHFPIGNVNMLKVGEPKLGDIVLFYYPVDPTQVYIKRVVGTPGDHIVYKNKILTVNGVIAKQTYLGQANDVEPGEYVEPINLYSENLSGVEHQIYMRTLGGETQDFDLVVPPKSYFMMGDNRDDSEDSRIWGGTPENGFVPEANIIGKAFGIWMHWDSNNNRIQWDRIGRSIH